MVVERKGPSISNCLACDIKLPTHQLHGDWKQRRRTGWTRYLGVRNEKIFQKGSLYYQPTQCTSIMQGTGTSYLCECFLSFVVFHQMGHFMIPVETAPTLSEFANPHGGKS